MKAEPERPADHDGGQQNADLAQRENGDHVDGERLGAERLELHHALLHHHRADQEADQGDDRHGPEAGMVEVMDEGGRRKRQGWRIMRPSAAVTSPRKPVSWTASLPYAGHRLGHVLGEELQRASLLELGPLGVAAALHLLDQDAEGFGRAGVAGTQAALLPGGGGALQQHRAGGVDLGDAGDVHLAGEVGRRRDRHAQALQRRVELGGLGHGPGAGRDQAEGRAPELDAEARGAGLGRQDNLVVALEHGRA